MAISRLNIDKSYGMQLTLTMTTMLMAIVAVFINWLKTLTINQAADSHSIVSWLVPSTVVLLLRLLVAVGTVGLLISLRVLLRHCDPIRDHNTSRHSELVHLIHSWLSLLNEDRLLHHGLLHHRLHHRLLLNHWLLHHRLSLNHRHLHLLLHDWLLLNHGLGSRHSWLPHGWEKRILLNRLMCWFLASPYTLEENLTSLLVLPQEDEPLSDAAWVHQLAELDLASTNIFISQTSVAVHELDF